MRGLRLALLATLAACTGGNATPTPPGLPTDPCALLTVHDVESATGSRVLRSGLVPDEMMIVPDFPNPCQYVTDGKDGSIRISVDPHGAATFDQYRDRDPVNNLAVEGIGDEAFVNGLATLWVRVGDGYFQVSTQLNPGPSGVVTLKNLAFDALGRMSIAS
jgi:hypothetical protein